MIELYRDRLAVRTYLTPPDGHMACSNLLVENFVYSFCRASDYGFVAAHDERPIHHFGVFNQQGDERIGGAIGVDIDA
jgi:hypothetical protein